MIAIVESHADRASTHICERLRECADWESREDDTRPHADGGGTWYRTEGAELRSFDALHLECERPVDAFDCDPDLLVFASRHAGETGPLLTGHFTGNFGPAEYGGDDHALAEACPTALVALLEAFDEYAPEGYDVGLECTHHGPTAVGRPSLFAELGSGDDQWDDPAGAEAVARAILELRDHDVAPAGDRRRIVGFGGSHYVPRFERIVRETPWAVGHVGADWALEAMGDPRERRDVIERAFEASGAEIAVVDDDRPALEAVIDELGPGYRTVSETWLREVGDRPLELVERVESELGTVDGGVRFGERGGDGSDGGEFRVVELPDDLVGAAEGIDADRVREVLERHAIAFETTNGGSRVGSRAAVPSPETRSAVVDDLAAVLEEKYDDVDVDRASGTVVARTLAFDPARAAELGVPEGPKFGALAGGSEVTVDGESISPDDVRSERVERFPIPDDIEE